MADLQKTIKQAIADFDEIETAIEECGIDVPYDTDTKEYGKRVKEVYQKGINDAFTTIKIISGGDAYSDSNV